MSDVTFNFQKVLSKNRLVGLWRMMEGYRLIYATANLCLALAAIAKTATFLLLRRFVDDVLPQERLDKTLLWVGAGFVLLSLSEGVLTFLSGKIAAYTSESIVRRLRNYLFDHIQRLSFAYHAESSTGDLVQRATSDVDALRRFFSDQAINAGRVVIIFVVNFVVLLNLNQSLAFVSIALVPVLLVVSFWFFKRINKMYESYQEQEAVLTTALQENLSGIRVVKVFARQGFEREKFNSANTEKFQRGKKLLTMHAFFWPATDVLCAAQLLIGLSTGALLAIKGDITLGTYMAYVGVIGSLIWPMRNLGRLIVQMSTGMVSYTRITEINCNPREALDEGEVNPTELKGEIAIENVSFEYEPGHPVLQGVSFHAQAGQVIALLGSTGSGKTSLVNLLPRFYDVTEGRILLDGVDLRRYPRRWLRQNIGIVDQEPFLFSRTIYDNVTYGVENVSKDRVEEASRAAAVHDSINSFPDGYQTLVGERGVTLSGGQKQRVAVARTLIKQPKLLILDDSTSAVDAETETDMRQSLNRLMEGRTTFIIAHRIQSIIHADLILVFDQGRIVQRGSHDQLFAEKGLYQQIFNLQTRIEDELQKEISGA